MDRSAHVPISAEVDVEVLITQHSVLMGVLGHVPIFVVVDRDMCAEMEDVILPVNRIQTVLKTVVPLQLGLRVVQVHFNRVRVKHVVVVMCVRGIQEAESVKLLTMAVATVAALAVVDRKDILDLNVHP